MGKKERIFEPLPPVTLEDLIPPEHFYRHLERTLDLAFVRDLVRAAYAEVGRPSIDPVVFFTLQLVLFFQGVRSERQLLRRVGDRLSLRWYVGYELTEALPEHSSLTRIVAAHLERLFANEEGEGEVCYITVPARPEVLEPWQDLGFRWTTRTSPTSW